MTQVLTDLFLPLALVSQTQVHPLKIRSGACENHWQFFLDPVSELNAQSAEHAKIADENDKQEIPEILSPVLCGLPSCFQHVRHIAP